MQIANEPTIIDSGPILVQEGLVPHRAVLRHLSDNDVTPWVSHWERVDFQGEDVVHHSFFDGYYSADEQDARQHFESRVLKYGTNRFTRTLERNLDEAVKRLRCLINAVDDQDVSEDMKLDVHTFLNEVGG